MTSTVLGKLTDVRFGVREGRIGLSFTLKGTSCVNDAIDCWDPTEVPPSEFSSWDLVDQDKQLCIVMRKVSQLLSDAKVQEVHQLNGIPVEFSFEDNKLTTWRILTEVL